MPPGGAWPIWLIVGTHSTNGVAKIHWTPCAIQPCPISRRCFPERFNDKTNGVTPRRWLPETTRTSRG